MKLIVISYEGTAIPNDKIEAFKDNVSKYLKDGSAFVVQKYSEQDLVSLAVVKAANKESVETEKLLTAKKAVEHAVEYITGRFSISVKDKITLCLSMSEVLHDRNEKDVLENAIDIIAKAPCTAKTMLEQKLSREETNTVLEVVRKLSKSYV